jgi:hypothetical protein
LFSRSGLILLAQRRTRHCRGVWVFLMRALIKVVGGGNVETNGNTAFSECSALKQFPLLMKPTSLGAPVFASCSVLGIITLNDVLTQHPQLVLRWVALVSPRSEIAPFIPASRSAASLSPTRSKASTRPRYEAAHCSAP